MICAMKRHRFYPSYAQKREWTGQVGLRADFSEQGDLVEVKVLRSSNYPLLDEAAVETLRKAQADIAMPPRLLGQRFSIEQTMIYELDGAEQGAAPLACPKP